MFKFLTPGAKIIKNSSSIITIGTLAVLAAVITTLALSSFTAEAQGTRGAIANLQLTSTSAGELTVSWDAASPTPTDYRVDWAKSGENYTSWKVDDGHVYPTPDDTTATIADLDHDTEYKIRMRARYYRGEHEGKSWGGPWATATITVAGEPAETPTPEPVKEEPVQQPPRDAPDPPAGTIDTLTAADDTGQLLLTWTAPNSDPTDYHINWTKSTEEYPANTAEAGNAHPTDTTHTLAGLEYDTNYNVRVRARYTDGENADSPWNGPWTETTAQVLQPLPAAAIMGGTAVTPDSQVLLTWFNIDEDASITGYQILRGPDADSLAIIEDDTGSTATSYTDETPPAGETHTYAVKARNASGLSPLSNTLTATVPAVEEEEELVSARHEDGERALVSNLGQIQLNSGAITGTQLGNRFEIALAFTTGTNPHGHHITSVQLRTRRSPFNTGTPNPQVSIRADNAGVPSETILFNFTPSSPIADGFATITFTTEDATTLQPNTTYWLYATTEGDNALVIRNTSSNDEDAVSNTDWKIADKRFEKPDGGTWNETRGDIFQMAIHGHAAPAFLVSNLDSPSTRIFFSRDTDTDSAKIAQAFSTANNENGTPTEFDFHGVTVQLGSAFSTASQLAARDILATVHKDSGGQPSDLVYTLTSPETYTVPVHSAPVTFSAPPGSILSSGITYWVKFEIAADSTFFTGGTSIVFEFATDNNEVQGPTTNNRWSIDNNSLWSPETLSWTLEVKSIKISVLGTPRYDTLVSNIDQPTLPLTLFVGPGYESAQSFHIPSGPLGQQYRLSSVRIIASSENPTHASVDLHADHNGTPGSHLASLTTPGDFAPGLSVKADFIAVAPRGTLLNTDTHYWIVFRNEQNLAYFDIQTTPFKTEDLPSLDGWTIGDRKVSKSPNQPWRENPHPIKMELLGTPFIRTNESDGPDLPGAGHNAHQTGAVVIPGIVSTGHLTPGLDYDHGHSGDYWWLETQRGHSYRVEVKFGDNPDNDTGGSAWMSFIDPDHDDYPYASGCCEADHNRDDGHTFVHFYRPTDDWNNQYLINVAAYDQLNTGSSTYNGPYTITMTDVTDIKKVATNLYKGTRTNLLNVHSTRQYAVPFTTSGHPDGYRLDRIRTHILTNGSPALSLYSNTSGVPNEEVCAFKNPTAVEQHVMWSDGPPAITFLAPDCHEDNLIANTTYWIVLDGTNYTPRTTDSDDQDGWAIGNVNAVKNSGSWSNLSSGTIPVEIWASER